MSDYPASVPNPQRAEIAAAIARVEAVLDESSRAVATYVVAMARATAAVIEVSALLRGNKRQRSY